MPLVSREVAKPPEYLQVSNLLAIMHNDISPHENHHVAAAFSLLQDERLDFMQQIASEVRNHDRLMAFAVMEATPVRLHPCYLNAGASPCSAAVHSHGVANRHAATLCHNNTL